MAQKKKPSPEEVDAMLADVDGMLGAAGHAITDTQDRELMRAVAAGEVSPEEARAGIIAEASRA